MIGIFVLMALTFGVAFAVSALWNFSSGRHFQRGFTRLIDAEISEFGFHRGRLTTFVSGRYRDRPVALRLTPSRDDDAVSSGEFVLTMQVRAPDSEAWKSGLANFGNPDLSRATFDLEGRYGLQLTLADGVLSASSKSPPGWMFSVTFDEERWRRMLAQMHVVAEWLETRARSQLE